MSDAQHFLIALDADKIQSYVFESARLPEVRGASQLMAEAGDKAREHLASKGGDVCYSAGGSLLGYIHATADDAEKLVAELEQEFLEVTVVATATAVAVPCDDDPRTNDDCFRQARKVAAYLLRRKKDGRSAIPYFEAPPYAQRCSSCDIRPANNLVKVPEGDEKRPICAPCEKKLEKGKGERGKQLLRFMKLLTKPDNQPLLKGYLGDLSSKIDDIDSPPTLEDVISPRMEKTADDIGVILLDGDGMGGMVGGLSWDHTEALSTAVEECLNTAICTALANNLHPVGYYGDISNDRPTNVHPFDIIFQGGDDLFIIVPAREALRIAAAIVDEFHNAAAKDPVIQAALKPDEKCTLSGGVVIAPVHYPIYYLQRLAEQLCKSAKQGRRTPSKSQDQNAATPQGWIDFEIIKSGSAGPANLSDMRGDRTREVTGAREWLRLYDKPYSVGKLKDLLCATRDINDRHGGLPKGQLLMMVTALSQDRLSGSTYLLYQLAKLSSDSKAREQLAKMVGDGNPTLSYREPPGWRRDPCGDRGVVYSSCIPDIADLYSIVDRKGKDSL